MKINTPAPVLVFARRAAPADTIPPTIMANIAELQRLKPVWFEFLIAELHKMLVNARRLEGGAQ